MIRQVQNGGHLVRQGKAVATPYLHQLSSLHSLPLHAVRRDGVFSSLSFSDITRASKHEQQILYNVFLNLSQDPPSLGGLPSPTAALPLQV